MTCMAITAGMRPPRKAHTGQDPDVGPMRGLATTTHLSVLVATMAGCLLLAGFVPL